MPRVMKSNGNAPTVNNTPESKPKKQWDVFLNTDADKEKGEESVCMGAFTIAGGKSKSGKPYLCLQGFSKELGKGINIFFSDKDGGGKNIDKLIDTLVAAGYLEQ